jgi:3-hydroxybutyryl-CoA dehydrogenase
LGVTTIAVIGAGVTGCAYAYAAAMAGFRVVLEDVSSTTLEQGIQSIRRKLNEASELAARRPRDENAQPKMDVARRDTAIQNILTAQTIEDAIRDADLIIETLPEEMEMHVELFTILDKFAKPSAIFACGTAALSITEMGQATFSADRCVGMRLHRDDVLELVRGLETSEPTIEICSDAARRMGKKLMIVHESGSSACTSAGR